MTRVAGSRVAGRIAWRQARRAPARSALIVALVALPIAGLSAASVAIRTAFATDAERVTAAIGSADLVAFAPSRQRGIDLVEALPPGAGVTSRIERGGTTIIDGRQISFAVDEFSPPPDRGPAVGVFHLVSGRMPTSSGEVALDPETLRALDGRIGDDVTIPVLGISQRITGTVVFPEYVNQALALVGPGTLAAHHLDARIAPSYLIDLPPSASTSETADDLRRRFNASTSTRDAIEARLPFGRSIATGIAFVAGLIALCATGLIAAAAFSVGTRRQLRTLGLVGAAGGEPRQLRWIVVLGGSVLGLTGSVVGSAVGIAVVLPARTLLGDVANRVVGPVRVPILPVVGTVLLGTVASTLAAYLPARTAARINTVEALAARTPTPRPPGRMAAAGVVVLAIGAAILAWSTRAHSDAGSAIGSTAMIAGLLVGIPLVVTWVGRLAAVLPTVPRIAARDLARHGRRTGAALAAATVALAVPVGVGALTLSQDAAERTIPFMAEDQLLVGFFDGLNQPTAEERRSLVSDLRAAFPDASVVAIRAATWPSGRRPYVAGPILSEQGHPVRANGMLIVGRGDVLRSMHAQDGVDELRAGTVVAIGPDATDGGQIHLLKRGPAAVPLPPGTPVLPAVSAGPTRYASLVDQYTYVISPAAAARADLTSEPMETIVVRLPSSVTDEDRGRAGSIVNGYSGASMNDLTNLGSQNGAGRWAVGVAGAALALAIVGVVVALMSEESRRDRAIVAAVGAAPRTRRALGGASAWVVAAVAGALAVPAGFVPVAVFRIAQARGYPIVVPWAAIAVAVVGVPIAAGVVGVLTARQPKPTSLLRPVA